MNSDELDAQMRQNEIQFRKIILDQLARYPKMEVQDLYKLIHQGVMGSEHAVDDHEGAESWLEKELSNLDSRSDEPVVDRISISGEIVRINLRPYIQAGGNPRALLNTFIKTANEFKGSREELMRCWAYVENMVREGDLDFPEDEVTSFIQQRRGKAFPAVHHSNIYKESYHPAYRVVALSILTRWKQMQGK